MRVACRILHYIFDIIEEGIIASRATKKLSSNSIKSLLVQYVFDPVIAEKIDHVTSLRDEKGHVIVSAFAPTLNNIIFRREAIKDLLKDIFKGFKISDIIVWRKKAWWKRKRERERQFDWEKVQSLSKKVI